MPNVSFRGQRELSTGLQLQQIVISHCQVRNEFRWRPGQEASLWPQCSNMRSFGSKCTVMKRALVTVLGYFGLPAVIRRPTL